MLCLGCCDIIIATKDSNIGVGGPAMIEGGGLGVFTPDEVGPMMQVPNGVVDISVKDEGEVVEVAKNTYHTFKDQLRTGRNLTLVNLDLLFLRIGSGITICET